VAHLCPVVAVMQAGSLVETLATADLRAGRIAHPYTAGLRALAVELA